MVDKKIDEIYEAVKTKATRVGVQDYSSTYHTTIIKDVTLEGLWMEFGVYRGRSITNFAENTDNTIYGFDSFEGLPEHWDHQNPKGCYSLAGLTPQGAIAGSNDDNPGMYSDAPTATTQPWPKNIELVKGLFEYSLPPFLEEHTGDAAFIHIDSDLYSSCKTLLSCLKDRIKSGTVIAFDEICDYPDYRDGEIKAFAEFLLYTNLDFECTYHQDLLNCPITGYSQACFIIKDR
tara:strand:+ start:836 stop:1534 length:699 start_codon:yes stop_codon:yes gene_type:complete